MGRSLIPYLLEQNHTVVSIDRALSTDHIRGVVTQEQTGWRVSGVFDFMTAHFGDGEADLARQSGTYLRGLPELADEFVKFYLDHKAVQPGFGKRQQLYMLYDSLLIWSFWQGHAGGLPEDNTLTLEQWAGPFVAYWEKF